MRIQSGVKVLVAGGTGFIGSNLVARVLALGADVTSTLHMRSAQITDPRVRYVRTDLLSAADCREAVKGQDIVFVCAANTSGAAVMAGTPLVHVTPNVILNTLLLEAAHEAHMKLVVFLSSSAAYPDKGGKPMEESEMFEGDPPDIYYPVGWMKRYSEILCRMYAEKIKNPMRALVIRPSNVFGPYDDYDFATSHMMAALIRRCVERQNPFTVWGSGEDVRDMIYIDDFVDGVLAAAEKYSKFESVNIAMGKAYSVKEILKMILEEDGFADADIRLDASKPSMLPVRRVDVRKAKKELGFTAKTDLREGIRRTLRWYRAHAGAHAGAKIG